MEDSCGPKKRQSASADAGIEIPARSNDAEESTGNVQYADFPHLVVENIVKYLDFKDLLQWSSVNKVWNHEARRVLREKHQCALTIDLDRNSAKDLIEFKAMLAASELPLPYGRSISIKTGMESKVPLRIWSREIERTEMAIRDIILEAGPFEVFQFDVKCEPGISFAACIIRNVLAAVQETVKVLVVKNLSGLKLLHYVRRFPELKKLEIDMKATIQERDMMSIENIIKYSEKLENLGLMSSSRLPLIKTLPPARKLALVKEFTCAQMDMSREVAAFAALEPKLEKLFILRNPRCRPHHHDPISMSLLLSSQDSLIELQATYEMLQKIRRENPLALFMNLRYLTVDLPLGMEREGLDQDTTIIALFPMLEKLEINT